MTIGLTGSSFGEIYRRSRAFLVLIGITHVILVAVTFWVLFQLNVKDNGQDFPLSNKTVMLNSSLLGFLGSLLYFSRKIYSYLITDKFNRVIRDQGITMANTDDNLDRFKSVTLGYYIYLSTRPIAGFIIGPLLLWSVLAGLTTFSKPALGTDIVISRAGTYLIYVLSFLGGYSSSDLFDYFSHLGGKLLSKFDIR